MFSLLRRSPRDPAGAATPDALRAAREAVQFTQEEAADLLGRLPSEVAAWESGVISLPPYEAEEVRWRMEHAAYEARLPRSDCWWRRANAARLARITEMGPRTASRTARELDAHIRECAECLRVEALVRDLPPPERPAPPGLRGWMERLGRRIARLPAWLRVPLQSAQVAVRLGAFVLLLALVRLAMEPSDGFHPRWDLYVLLLGGGLGFIHLSSLLLPLCDRRPYLGNLLLATGSVTSAALALGLAGFVDLASGGTWFVVGLISLVIGGALGQWEVEARDEEAEDPLAEPAREERVVVIRQKDTSWRPW